MDVRRELVEVAQQPSRARRAWQVVNGQSTREQRPDHVRDDGDGDRRGEKEDELVRGQFGEEG